MRRVVLASVLAGCALTSKAKPLDVRYFSVEAATAPTTSAAPTTPRARVRLGRITPAANLRYAIVHRESRVEVVPYETLRWTDTPDTFVRRALSRALFEARPLEQAIGGDAITLDVELVAFEEAHDGPRHAGRVELSYALTDAHHVIARGSVAAERVAADASIEAVVVAVGRALDDAAGSLADRVAAALPANDERS